MFRCKMDKYEIRFIYDKIVENTNIGMIKLDVSQKVGEKVAHGYPRVFWVIFFFFAALVTMN